MDIMSGYLLKIMTWENDVDNYRTTELSGLSRDHVEFYVTVSQLFSRKNYGNAKIFSYGLTVNAEISKIVEDFKTRNLSILSPWIISETITEFSYDDTIGNLVGVKNWNISEITNDFRYIEFIDKLVGVWGEGEYYRVFHKFQVFYIPEIIKDVTNEFVK